MSADDMAECRCVECGKPMRADDYDRLWVKYTHHQVDEHGKPYKSENA